MTANQREFNDESARSIALSPKVPGEDYALVIGVNDYPKLRPLRGAIADARAFADWLVDAMGGNVPMRNVFAVFSSPEPLAPIGHELNDALESIFTLAEKTGGRRLYFYFSGHGCVGDRASDIALCLANWSSLRRRAALSSDAWLDVVVRSGLFDEVAFFLDCCRVWATRGIGLPPQIDYVKPVERAQSTRVFMAFATEHQRTAIEVVANAKEVRGIFTQVLIEGLKSMAQDVRGNVTAASLKEYLERHTPKQAMTFGVHQRAEVLNGFDPSSQFGPVYGNRSPTTKQYDTPPRTGLTSIENLSHVARLSCNPATFMKRHEAGIFIALFNQSHIEWSLRRGNDVITITREISKQQHAENRAEEWIEFSQVMKPGAYVLHCSSAQPREVALHLYSGWATQVIIDDASEPHFENVHVLLVAQESRTMPTFVENGLALLASAATMPPDEWADVPQHDPLLGLIAAHLLSRGKTPDLERINNLVDRVEAMLGPCPDVYALRLRVALIRGGDLPRASFTDPPMLREGLLAFVEASHTLAGLIPSDSLLEYACVERLVDSPLSTWPARRTNQANEDWLMPIIEDLTNEKGGDTSTLDEATIARELGVPTRAITTRIEVTRQRSAATKAMVTVPVAARTLSTTNAPNIPGYELDRVIGKGGMGRVYLAKRIATNERVAIKVHVTASSSVQRSSKAVLTRN